MYLQVGDPTLCFQEGGMSSQHQYFVRKSETEHRVEAAILKEGDDDK